MRFRSGSLVPGPWLVWAAAHCAILAGPGFPGLVAVGAGEDPEELQQRVQFLGDFSSMDVVEAQECLRFRGRLAQCPASFAWHQGGGRSVVFGRRYRAGCSGVMSGLVVGL